MIHYRVFLGAPSVVDLDTDPSDYVWKTFQEPAQIVQQSQSLVYLPATLDAASRRISQLYQNVIFDSSDSQELELDHVLGSQHDNDHPDGTTFLTWPPTPAPNTTGGPSSPRPSGSIPPGTYETQETGTSIEYSDASSIARFPNFQFSLHKVTPLPSLYNVAKLGRESHKVNVLLAVLEVQGPDTVHVKKGPEAGQQVSVLKLILADDQGSVCKLTAWRDTADDWGGLGLSPGLKRGDIAYFQNVTATWETGSTITLTASPYNKPITEICYRTMPYTTQDNKLRPDLRLGQSDAVVSKVAALVRWFEYMAGLPGS